MNIIDQIAKDHAYLLKDQNYYSDGHEAQFILSKTIDEPLSLSKTASFMPSRMIEIIDIDNKNQDVHQEDDTGIFWQRKKGHIVRVVPNLIKG